MAEEKLNITASVLRAENKYLTWVITAVVGILVATLGVVGNFQVKATNTNTAEVKLLRGDISEMNITTNNRINQITSRLDVGRERTISAYKLMQHNIDQNTSEIEMLKQKHEKD